MNRILMFISIVCTSTVFGQTQIGTDLLPSNPEHEEQYGFRSKLSADGNTAAVSAPIYESAAGVAAGRVLVYENIDNSWVQKGTDIDGDSFCFRIWDSAGHDTRWKYYNWGCTIVPLWGRRN